MGKVFGILVIVAGIWIGMQIFTKGTDDAPGAFAPSGELSQVERADEPGIRSQKRVGGRAKAKVEKAFADGAARYDNQLDAD